MESESSTSGVGVVRHKAPSVRGHPYAEGSGSVKENMREEVIQLGVELSVYVAQLTFFLFDDIRVLSFFCFKLWRHVLPYPNPILERLFLVIHHVHSNPIKPNNRRGRAYWTLTKVTWNNFSYGIRTLHRLVSFHSSKLIANYKQTVLSKLEDDLRHAKHIYEANGFVREMIEPYILHLWKSLFAREANQIIKIGIVNDLFKRILGKSSDTEIRALPIYYSDVPIPGTDFAKQEMKREAVRLGAELSLYVAQTMFLLSDEVRSMFWFCILLWRDVLKRDITPHSRVLGRMLRVIHYVYFTSIEPKKGVYRNGVTSAHWGLAREIAPNFDAGFTYLDLLLVNLKGEGSCFDSRVFTSSIEEELKRLEEKLSPAKAVLEAKGYMREVLECRIYGFWKSLCDEKSEEATNTLKTVYDGMILDVFRPLENEVEPQFLWPHSLW